VTGPSLCRATVAAFAVLLAAAPAKAGQFDGIRVRIGTFGGKWRDIVEDHVGKAFAAEGGTLEYLLGQPANNVAKLIAARGQEPPIDVLETLDNFLPQLSAGGYLAKIDLSKVPNAKQLDPALYDDTRVMVWLTEEGIIYNKAKFAEAGIPAPKTYADLADPHLKGKVSVPDISAGGAMPALVGMSHEAGGSEKDIGPGLDLIQKIAPANFWSSSSNLQTLLAGGDVFAAAAQAGNVQRLKGQVDLGIVFPPVGSKTGVLKGGYLIKVNGTHQSAAVDWIINAFLAEPMQVATLTEGGQVPLARDALSELAKNPDYAFMRLSPEAIGGMYQIDFKQVDETAYVKQWNRKIGH
jgi:putative spermidine/putrescine transport system substrate-binding protein